MPLRSGSDKATISANIREMVAAGHPVKQAIAASLSNARRHAVGGLVNRRFADGGGLFNGTGGNLFQSTPGQTQTNTAPTSSAPIGAPSTGPTVGDPMLTAPQTGIGPTNDTYNMAGPGWNTTQGGTPYYNYGTNPSFTSIPSVQATTGTQWQNLPYDSTSLGLYNVHGQYTVPTAPASAAAIQQQYPGIGLSTANTALTPTVAAPLAQQVLPFQYTAGGSNVGPPLAQNPYYSAATTGTLRGGNAIHLTPAEQAQLLGVQGLKGDALMAALPASLQGLPKGDPRIAQLTAAQNQWEAAFRSNPNDAFALQQMHLASNALNTALYGPTWQNVLLANGTATGANPNSWYGQAYVPLTPAQIAANRARSADTAYMAQHAKNPITRHHYELKLAENAGPPRDANGRIIISAAHQARIDANTAAAQARRAAAGRQAMGGRVNRRFADGGGLFDGTGGNLFQSTPGATQVNTSGGAISTAPQIGTGATPLENWQQNTPALSPQTDAWTSQANTRLQGWQGGNVLDAYGGNQIGFGPTPLQNYAMQGNPTTTPGTNLPPAPVPPAPTATPTPAPAPLAPLPLAPAPLAPLPWIPHTQADLAAQYGYGNKSVMRPEGWQNEYTYGQIGANQNATQTLQQMGWVPGQGRNQSPSAVNPGTGKPWTPQQIQMFYDLQGSSGHRVNTHLPLTMQPGAAGTRARMAAAGVPMPLWQLKDHPELTAAQRLAIIKSSFNTGEGTPRPPTPQSHLGEIDRSLGPQGSTLAPWLRPYVDPQGQTVPLTPPAAATAGSPVGKNFSSWLQSIGGKQALPLWLDSQGGQAPQGIDPSRWAGISAALQKLAQPGGMASGGKVGGLGQTRRGPPDEPSDRATMIPVGLIR